MALHSTFFCAAGHLTRAMLGLMRSQNSLSCRLRHGEDPGAARNSMAFLPVLFEIVAGFEGLLAGIAAVGGEVGADAAAGFIGSAASELASVTPEVNAVLIGGVGAYNFGEPTWENTHDGWQTLGAATEGAVLGGISGYALGGAAGGAIAADAEAAALTALSAVSEQAADASSSALLAGVAVTRTRPRLNRRRRFRRCWLRV
ncbi:unnamed protein product [Symbiodinium sp. CCMP2592]|nr:unnamed protein product [Symbiodinium sp. CCMP2592]